ncbi:hypothetical protein ACFL5O_09845 [Myxococcota bacterium]
MPKEPGADDRRSVVSEALPFVVVAPEAGPNVGVGWAVPWVAAAVRVASASALLALPVPAGAGADDVPSPPLAAAGVVAVPVPGPQWSTARRYP